jgi:LysM repeat protein
MSTIVLNPSPASSNRAIRNRKSSNLRLTPRGHLLARLAVIASLSILLLSAYSALSGATAGAEENSLPSSYLKVSVKPGDTLWSIAAEIDPSGDRRELVDELMRINNMKSPRLESGEKIYLPTR